MSKIKVEIIYTDDDIFVINKPTGVSVTKDRSGAAELLDFLSEQLEPQICTQLRLIHRLDKDTSGVMILAKNKQTQSRLSSCFEKRLIKKTYIALVTGAVMKQQGKINSPLARSRKNPAIMCITPKRGKQASTNWELLADFGVIKLLAVYPVTGRTHQIRVHLPGIGLPLAIDPLYGNNQPLFLSDLKANYRLKKNQTEKPLIERLTLHAYQINLPESQPNRPDYFVAGLDKKFKATIKMLAKHNPEGLDAFVDPEDFNKIINNQKLS
ncbi:MAG: RluA family pseudouridine synthase [Planctomycetes bacterium]|nr:RluA family pseudouridine synthase [Planctomycetota bacterium]